MKSRAYAKINLSLDVVRRREDGYHELESVMCPICLYDEIEINKAEKMSYSCNKWYVKFRDNNTIVKAINYMKEHYQITDNFEVKLNKFIPVKAGLAGGSTDGACVIRMLNRLYDLKMSKEEIKEACLSIGADVIFTYYSRPALVSGIGEKLEFFDIKDDYYVLLVKPNAGVSTKDAYQQLDLSACAHPDVKLLMGKLIKGEDLKGYLGNSLEYSSFRLCPEISKIKEEMEGMMEGQVLMSGSGSTVFAISKSKKEIEELYHLMKMHKMFVKTTRLLKSARA